MRALTLALLAALLLLPAAAPAAPAGAATDPPIYIAFLWHMHQPIYWPYESVLETDANARYSYSVVDIHNQRIGPYTSWPKDAVREGDRRGDGALRRAGEPHRLADREPRQPRGRRQRQLPAAGRAPGTRSAPQSTTLGNPRLDLVGFGYHHPLMGLVETVDLRKQIQAHRTPHHRASSPARYSRGIFPPENAFTPRMIPALRAEGIDWVLVDNVHFDRAAPGYPFSTAGNLYEPNLADVRNPNPADWVQLTDLWAPTRISGAWGHRPHYVAVPRPGERARSPA